MLLLIVSVVSECCACGCLSLRWFVFICLSIRRWQRVRVSYAPSHIFVVFVLCLYFSIICVCVF